MGCCCGGWGGPPHVSCRPKVTTPAVGAWNMCQHAAFFHSPQHSNTLHATRRRRPSSASARRWRHASRTRSASPRTPRRRRWEGAGGLWHGSGWVGAQGRRAQGQPDSRGGMAASVRSAWLYPIHLSPNPSPPTPSLPTQAEIAEVQGELAEQRRALEALEAELREVKDRVAAAKDAGGWLARAG